MQLSYNPPAPSWCFHSPVCSGVSHAARALRRRRTQHHKAPKGRGWWAHVKLLKHPKFVGQLGHKTCHVTIACDITSACRFCNVSWRSACLKHGALSPLFSTRNVQTLHFDHFVFLEAIEVLHNSIPCLFLFHVLVHVSVSICFVQKLSSMEHHCGPHQNTLIVHCATLTSEGRPKLTRSKLSHVLLCAIGKSMVYGVWSCHLQRFLIMGILTPPYWWSIYPVLTMAYVLIQRITKNYTTYTAIHHKDLESYFTYMNLCIHIYIYTQFLFIPTQLVDGWFC